MVENVAQIFLSLTVTFKSSCFTNHALYVLRSAFGSASLKSNLRTRCGISLHISINEMFLPRQVLAPWPN